MSSKIRLIHLDWIGVDATILPNKRLLGVSLSVNSKTMITIKCGRLVPEKLLIKFINSKREWIEKKINLVKNQNPLIKMIHTKEEIENLKVRSKSIIENKIEVLNSKYGFLYNSINIGTYKTKWGSCSKVGNISFNYKLALLPEMLQEYLIVHELCHLGEFNHSKKFWDLVAKSIPNHKILSKKLRVGDF